MTPVKKLLAQLTGVKKRKGYSAHCPAHGDRQPSLSITEGDDGRALVKCNAGCSVEDVVSAIGLTKRDLMPGRATTKVRNGKAEAQIPKFYDSDEAVMALEKKLGPHSEWWRYNTLGGDVGYVLRWDTAEGKKTRPISLFFSDWTWRIAAMPKPRPLFLLPKLIRTGGGVIVVAGGENAACAADILGFTATTSFGGANAADKTNWTPLAGKEVWILPDNDPSGEKYAESVAGILSKLTPRPVVKIVTLKDLPEGGDLVDWIEAHGDEVDVEAMRAEIEALATNIHAAQAKGGK
jgi:putative DNA primase/helicase